MDAKNDWALIRPKYKIKEDLGEGTQGHVVRVKERSTGKEFAIKYIKNVFINETFAKYIAREIEIMTQLSKMENNIYTTRLHEVICAGDLDNY